MVVNVDLEVGDLNVDLSRGVVEVECVEALELDFGCKECSVKSLIEKGLWHLVVVNVCLVESIEVVHGLVGFS